VKVFVVYNMQSRNIHKKFKIANWQCLNRGWVSNKSR